MDSQEEIKLIKKALERERLARKEAERILEEKSMDLYNANLKLKNLNVDLEEGIQSTKLELLKTETRFNELVYTASDIIFKVDLLGNFKYVNKVAVELSGFSEEEFLNNNFLFMVRSDYKSKLINHFQSQLEKKLKSTYIEFPAISKNGDEVWLGQSTNLIFEEGNPTEFFGLARNISGRKEAENLTNYTKTKLEAIIENLNSGILVEDKNRFITKVNQTFCELFGIPVSPDDLLGTDCSSSAEDIKHLMSNPEEFVGRINEIVEKREVALSEEVKMKDGTYLERDYVPLYLEGQFIGQLWKYRDITVNKKEEILLKKSEEKYRGVMENLNLGILEVDVDNNITKAYNQFCQMTGYTQQELIGKNPADIFLNEESKKVMDEHNKRREEGVSSAYEVPIITKDGSTKWLIISGAPYFDKAGNLLGTFGLHLDISERKKMESDLLSAKLKAEELNKVKELFLANVSHEIRTPMNAIIGMTELLRDSKLNNNQIEYLEAIEKASEGLLALINDVLDFSKIESGEITISETDFNLRDLINQVNQTLSYKAEQNGVSIDVCFGEGIPAHVRGDKDKLNQVLLNLVSNAVKFTKNGLVQIEVELSKKLGENALINFKIVDEGIGISSEEISSIFENFKQANPNISREYGGTGLGLPISQKIVKLLGGEIKVISEIGRGSEFSFEVELAMVERVKKKEDVELVADFKGARVLIVEDNPVNLLMVSTALKKWNCIFSDAKNGIEALDILQNDDFDLILMDLQMPKMGGLEACEIIRNKMGIEIPIIALTANAVEGDSEKCMDAGMNDYLSKPFKQKDLNLKLKEWVSI